MLALSFFAAIFSSLLWLIYSLAYISDNTVGIKFSALGIVDISVYVALVALPILIVWVIFGYVIQYMNFRSIDRNLYILFRQMKKNQDYTDLIARIMLESEQQIKDGFILNRIDILISDMNELIAEIISRAALASKEQIESLWSKVRNGGKWAFGKVIIEISQNQPNFQMRIFEKSQKDTVLAGTVLEFCARYQNILSLLEKHDKERVFLNVIETGIFGKVYSILAPIADEIRRHRDISSLYNDDAAQDSVFSAAPVYAQNPAPARRFEKKAEPTKPSLLAGISKLSLFKKKEKTSDDADVKKERDPFSIALERSFGGRDPAAEETTEAREPRISMPETEPAFDNEPRLVPQTESVQEEFLTEPRFEAHLNEEERAELTTAKNDEPAQEIPAEENNSSEKDAEQTETVEEIAITSTQKTLNELRKEWEDMRKTSQAEEKTKHAKEPKSENEDFAYPFGGWTDESNYK